VTSAWVVVDLAFGDSGKGTITDWLVRRHGAKLVVRWNGGAQAGHNVVTADGRHHTFSQFGSGHFVEGVRTHLSEEVVVHPTALLVEAGMLERGALARLTIAESARIVTPCHQAAGRLRELATRHGSCGVGVGEAVRDCLEHPDDALRARDLRGDCREKLRRIQERLRASAPDLDHPERRVLDDAGLCDRWMEAIGAVRPCIVADDALKLEGPVVLEGAHGVLLDEWRGFHPHTTWHPCTSDAALAFLKRHGFDGEVQRLGVLRTYLTRHGAGPFPTHLPLPFAEAHNSSEGWQGEFRTGWPDLVLARYAVDVSPVDGLALTHVDRFGSGWKVATRYESFDLRPGPARDLVAQERLTWALRSARPVLEEAPDLIERFEGALGVRVVVTSNGPTAADKQQRS
jgi:adenylosuccinate synthase